MVMGVESAESAEVEIVESDEEKSEHQIAESELFLAEEESGDSQLEKLCEGIAVEAHLTHVPHKSQAKDREGGEEGVGGEIGARHRDKHLVGSHHFIGEADLTRPENIVDGIVEQCHRAIREQEAAGADEAEDEDNAETSETRHGEKGISCSK